MIFTTPPETAPVIWCLGGPWHGRRILRPGRAIAFELAILAPSGPWIRTYRYLKPFRPDPKGMPQPLYAEGWEGDVERDGCWMISESREGTNNRDVHYLYRETADAR